MIGNQINKLSLQILDNSLSHLFITFIISFHYSTPGFFIRNGLTEYLKLLTDNLILRHICNYNRKSL